MLKSPYRPTAASTSTARPVSKPKSSSHRHNNNPKSFLQPARPRVPGYQAPMTTKTSRSSKAVDDFRSKQRVRASDPLPKASIKVIPSPKKQRVSLPLKHVPLLARLPLADIKAVGAGRAKGKLPQAGLRGSSTFTSARLIVDSSESEEDSEDEVGSVAGSGSDNDTDEGMIGGEGLNKESNTSIKTVDPAYIDQCLHNIKQGPLMTKSLSEAQEIQRSFEDCVGRSKELFIEFLGQEVAGGLMKCMKEVEIRLQSSIASYETKKEKHLRKLKKDNEAAQALMLRHYALTQKLVQARQASVKVFDSHRDGLEQRLLDSQTAFDEEVSEILRVGEIGQIASKKGGFKKK